MTGYSFAEFMDIIRKLRSEEGCPWDREQTHSSLKPCLMEESYETIEAIDRGDMDNLCEELGDLLLQVALHSVIAEEKGEFTIDEVVGRESEKMVRRHPHVFGDVTVNNSDDVLKNWDKIKEKEKADKSPAEDILSIPKAFPAILRTQKVLKKTMKAGIPVPTLESTMDSLSQGLKKLQNSITDGEDIRISEKFGELLFSMISLSLILQLNAENSLTNATNKFINKVVDVFALADRQGRSLCDISFTEQDALWRDKE